MGNLFSAKKDKVTEKKVKESKNNKEAVVHKLMNSVYKEKLKGNQAMLDRLAICLSEVEEMKDSYLISDWMQTVKVHQQFDDVAVKARENKSNEEEEEEGEIRGEKKGGAFTSVPNPSVPEEIKVEGRDEAVTGDELRDAEQDPSIKQLQNKVKIKIIVSEVAHTSSKRSFRRFISPILAQLNVLPEMGMFHSALMVGPWLIEWNNSALCIPRKCVSRAALLSADIDALDTKDEVETVIDKLANVIVKWNSTRLYHDTDSDKETYGNCQDFVNDVLLNLGIECNFQGPLASFLERLRTTGNEKLVFMMDEEFRKKFEVEEKTVEFKVHTDLDKFVNKLQLVCPEFQSEHRHEYGFLKSFDRAFWMKHFKFPNQPEFKPLYKDMDDDDDEDEGENDEEDEEEKELNCPFKNPMETYSIRFIN